MAHQEWYITQKERFTNRYGGVYGTLGVVYDSLKVYQSERGKMCESTEKGMRHINGVFDKSDGVY